MASRNYAPIKALARGQVVIAGNFLGNGTSNPASATVIGNGFDPATITRVSQGLYRLTFSGQFQNLTSISAMVAKGATAATALVITDMQQVMVRNPLQTTVSGRKVTQVDFYVFSPDGTEALEDLATDSRLYFTLVFDNSTVRPSKGR